MTKIKLSPEDYKLAAFHLLLHTAVDVISQKSDRSQKEILELLKYRMSRDLPIVLRDFDEKSLEFVKQEFSSFEDL